MLHRSPVGRSGFLRRFPSNLFEEDHMTFEDIKAAVDAGQTVHWANTCEQACKIDPVAG